MDYDQDIHPYMPLFSAVPMEHFFTQFQLVMMAGKTVETLAVSQARYVIEGSYSQTLKRLEEVDSSIGRLSEPVDSRLRFPFDVMDHTTRTVSETWRILMGLETAAELKLVEEIENQSKLSSRTEKQLKVEIAALTERVSKKDEQLLQQQSENEKARKAKQSAQRTQRKLKTELEANNEKVSELKAETNTTIERYDQQLSENALLQTQKQQVDLELAEARQETQNLKTDSEQMASKIEALTAEQEKLLAEKDGLHKRIEELQRQVEQSSHYTE